MCYRNVNQWKMFNGSKNAKHIKGKLPTEIFSYLSNFNFFPSFFLLSFKHFRYIRQIYDLS